jgi:hypothetical protein
MSFCAAVSSWDLTISNMRAAEYRSRETEASREKLPGNFAGGRGFYWGGGLNDF